MIRRKAALKVESKGKDKATTFVSIIAQAHK